MASGMTPEFYREQAERHRRMAEGASSDIRESLLRIASSYDELAALQERTVRVSRERGGRAR
jgi:hypothetical protein